MNTKTAAAAAACCLPPTQPNPTNPTQNHQPASDLRPPTDQPTDPTCPHRYPPTHPPPHIFPSPTLPGSKVCVLIAQSACHKQPTHLSLSITIFLYIQSRPCPALTDGCTHHFVNNPPHLTTSIIIITKWGGKRAGKKKRTMVPPTHSLSTNIPLPPSFTLIANSARSHSA